MTPTTRERALQSVVAVAAAVAIAKVGHVSVDGLDDVTQAGGLYLALVMELAQRIQAWSTLGESAGSSSAP